MISDKDNFFEINDYKVNKGLKTNEFFNEESCKYRCKYHLQSNNENEPGLDLIEKFNLIFSKVNKTLMCVITLEDLIKQKIDDIEKNLSEEENYDTSELDILRMILSSIEKENIIEKRKILIETNKETNRKKLANKKK